MQSWVPFAMVRITLFLNAGILLGIYQPDILPVRVATFFVVFLVAVYFIGQAFRQYSGARYFFGAIGLSSILLFGFVHVQHRTARNQLDHIIHRDHSIEAYEAVVRSAPESKAKSWKVLVEVVRVKAESWENATGNVLLYISKTSFNTVPWLYGDRLVIRGAPKELTPPANPGEFDYQRFLSFRNIYHQQYLQGNQVKFLASVQKKGVVYYSHQIRSWAAGVINQYIAGEQTQAIAHALILGVTDGIDTDLQNAYAASGAMHVLAVSGLHVGIIYGILLFILRPLRAYAWSRWVIAAISIVSLWTFAFVTGLSPSVLRAVTMFSFIALARPLGWRTNIYNTLAASAFVLLSYNPYLIMSVGFQLSYLAVLGIVYLQRPIYNLWEVKNRIGDWVWQITCVSIAAQIATFALGMLYFHQFPVYFLFSNLFVIPLSTLVLVGGIILLGISWFTSLASLAGLGLQNVIDLLNWLVFKTETLPFSLISNIYFTTLQCWLIIGLIGSVMLAFQFRSLKPMLVAGVLIVSLIATQIVHQFEIKPAQFIVYNVTGYSAMEFMQAGKSYGRMDSALLQDEERIRFHIRPSRLFQGIQKINLGIPFAERIATGFYLVRWGPTTIALIEDDSIQLPAKAAVDYLVISKNSVPDPRQIESFQVKKIILDSSNSYSFVSRWRTWASKSKIEVHSVRDKGAFVLTL